MIISHDFNLQTTISHSFGIKSKSTAKILLNYLFRELDSEDYQDLIMLEWPRLSNEGEIQMIGSFFKET